MTTRTITVDADLLDYLIDAARAERVAQDREMDALRSFSEGAERLQGLAQGRKDGAVDQIDALVKLRESAKTTGATR